MTEKEFNFKKELQKIFDDELFGKLISAGRIYRKFNARDKEFIKRLKEKQVNITGIPVILIGVAELDKLAGENHK